MTEMELLQRLYLASVALARLEAADLRGERFLSLCHDRARLAPIGELLLLHDEIIIEFILEDAPRLVDALRRRTRRERLLVAGGRGARGRLDWAATTRARCGHPSNRQSTVCLTPRYDYDQPEIGC